MRVCLAAGTRPEVIKLAPVYEAFARGGRLAHLTAAFDAAWKRIGPDMVAVQGDTSTTLAAALSAFSRRIPVAHVEAEPRTFDLGAPFPEEAWRAMVTQIAVLHLAPTESAAARLVRAE